MKQTKPLRGNRATPPQSDIDTLHPVQKKARSSARPKPESTTKPDLSAEPRVIDQFCS